MTELFKLGKYLVRRQIGKGSMGVVYEAFDPMIERSVAIKVIREDEFAPSERAELLTRLKREAQAAGRLNHPAIVAIHDYGEQEAEGGGVAFIAMELIKGQELKALFDAGKRFSTEDIERILCDLLGALAHAHQRGVTHRDIKPANVILLPDGAVKVADFGVARIDSSELTQTGMVLGTPMYMAPEQLLGLEVDGRADLFACGVLLYQFLTGDKPFLGSVATVIQKVLNEAAPPPTRANPALVSAWDSVLDKALAKKVEARFQSAEEFADAIRAAASSQRTEPPVAALASADEATLILPRAGVAADASDEAQTLVQTRPPLQPSAPPVPAAQQPSQLSPTQRAQPLPPPSQDPLPQPTQPSAAPATATAPSGHRGWVAGAVISAAAGLAAGGYLWLRPPPPGPSASTDLAVAALATAASAAATPATPATPAPPSAAASASPVALRPMVAASTATLTAPTTSPRTLPTPPPTAQKTAPAAASIPAPSAPLAAPPSPPAVGKTLIAAAPPAKASAVNSVVPAPLGKSASLPAKAASAAGPAAAPRPDATTREAAASAAAPTAQATEWQQRRQLSAGRPPATLAEALIQLLDVRGAEQRQPILDLDNVLKQERPYVAFAMGVRDDGSLLHSWRTAASTGQAQTAALDRCRGLNARSCRLVQIDGRFDKLALNEVAAALGQRSVSDTRRVFTYEITQTTSIRLATLKSQTAPGSTAAATPAARTDSAAASAAAPPGRATADARPAAAWPAAQAALQRGRGQNALPVAMAALLSIDSDDDKQVLVRFEKLVQRLQWKSAMAIGEQGGLLHFGYAAGEGNDRFAADGALANCARSRSSNCAVVMSNGKFNDDAFIAVAAQLGSRPQAAVREFLLRNMRRSLESGR